MYKVGIIELKNENHSVGELCKFLDPNENEITLFTTINLNSKIQEDLGTYSKSIQSILKEDDESYYSFIKKINLIGKTQLDILILNTVNRWELLFLNPNCPIVAYFYSINFWFKDLKSFPTLLIKSLEINYLNLLSWRPNRWHANPYFGPLIRLKILKRIDVILVEYPPFIEQLNLYKCKKPSHFIPKKVYEEYLIGKNTDKVILTITGMISKHRKDYEVVINAIENLPSEVYSKIKLIVLGKPIGKYGLRIIKHLKKLEEMGVETISFVNFVSSSDFSNLLSITDIIIAPIKFKYKSGVIREKYTYTKGTGTFSDMLQFAKPSIVPAEYNIADEFKKCFITYKNEADLSNIIYELIKDNDKLDQIKKDTTEILSKYNLKYMQNQFSKILHQYKVNNK